jgi:diguanylate cyclase (GGDEF)-like protein
MFVLVVGLLNVALGFVAAVALTEPPPWNRWLPGRLFQLPQIKWRWPKLSLGRWALPTITLPTITLPRPAAPPLTRKTEPRPAPPPPRPAGFKLEELPQRWLELLGAEGVTPGSFLEASAHVMRLELSQYREQLITAENRTRAALAATDANGLRQLCDDLKQVNQDWLKRQTEAAKGLKERQGGHGDYERAAAELEQVLHDQAASIAECSDTIAALHCRTEIDTGCKRVFERLAQLIDQAHALRDRLNDLLATILRNDGGLAGVATTLQHDHATGLPNRIGIELIFRDWWHDDPQRQRQLSAALIDIDRFVRVNQRLGTRVGDRTIAAFSGLLTDLFRRDRGSDRLVRMSGQSLLVFFGDTGPHQALSAVERARQTIEATTWDDHGSEYDLTISAGVCEIHGSDSLPDVLARLAETLKFAKLAGRNRAALDEGDGPRLLDPPQFTVKGRIVSVGDEPQ